MSRASALMLALALGLATAGCGKRGDVEPPPDAELYKRSYPASETGRAANDGDPEPREASP